MEEAGRGDFVCREHFVDEERRRRSKDTKCLVGGGPEGRDHSFVAVAQCILPYKMPLKITKEMSSHLIKYVRTVNFSFNGEFRFGYSVLLSVCFCRMHLRHHTNL